MPSNKKINSIVTELFIRGRKLNTYLAFEQSKKQIKTLEEHGKQLVESHELIKKYFNIDRDSTPFNEYKKINELVDKETSKFKDLGKRINSDNLIYKYKTEE